MSTQPVLTPDMENPCYMIRFYGEESETDPVALFTNEAARGNLAEVVRMTEAGCPATHAALDCAVANGHLSVAKYLAANRKEGMTLNGVVEALANRNFHTAIWAAKNRSDWYVNYLDMNQLWQDVVDDEKKNGPDDWLRECEANRLEAVSEHRTIQLRQGVIDQLRQILEE